MSFNLDITGDLRGEIAHHYESNGGDRITSTANRFTVLRNGSELRFSVPLTGKKKLFSMARLTRRALRIDKSNAVFNQQRDGVVVLFFGTIYFYDLVTEKLTQVGQLKQCRNVLHCGIAVTKRGIFFGEYGNNRTRRPVPVWRSTDDGRSWKIVYEFPAKSIKHVHGVFEDPHSERLWVPTGDFTGECYLAAADPDFKDLKFYGDQTQKWRFVSMWFQKGRIIWPMDSQLEISYLQEFDRQTETLKQHCSFPGPIWYSKQFSDGIAILQTTVEIGDGVLSNYAHLFVSKNLIDWSEVARFPKDRWPMRYFKFGVLAFADGPQTSDDFVIFGEAIKGLDGRIIRVALHPT